jgi:ribosomal protein S6--L-glutamate ligase
MSKHVVALVSGFGWHVQDLRRAAGLLGIRLEAVGFPRIEARLGCGGAGVEAGGIDLEAVDAVLVRMMPAGTLEQVVFRMDALHRLVARSVRVVNPPAAIEAAVDKYFALARVEAAGLRVPPTWVGESAERAMEAYAALGDDVVVKPLFGAEGRGMMRVSEPELARRAFGVLARLGAVIYLQRYIPNAGSDLRVFVLGRRVVASMRRHAPAGDWRTNVAVGGRAERVMLDTVTEDLALRAARAIGARMAGVDLLFDPEDRPHVLEINAVPGWKALAEATGIDVAAAILDEVVGGDGRP